MDSMRDTILRSNGLLGVGLRHFSGKVITEKHGERPLKAGTKYGKSTQALEIGLEGYEVVIQFDSITHPSPHSREDHRLLSLRKSAGSGTAEARNLDEMGARGAWNRTIHKTLSSAQRSETRSCRC